MTSNKTMSLVRYAGDYWITLSDFTKTRDAEGYSDLSSVKSAVRTFVVKSNPDKYIAFRGEKQLKNIIHPNRNNPLFDEEGFKGTRTALISVDMLESLNNRFKVSKEHRASYTKFVKEANEYMEAEAAKAAEQTNGAVTPEDEFSEANTSLVRHLRSELARIDKEVEVRMRNREKILGALHAIESLELEEVI